MTELWRPSPERAEAAALTRFARGLQDEGVSAKSSGSTDPGLMARLHDWSVRNPATFWERVWCFAEVLHSRAPSAVLEQADRMPGARWFNGARLNFAENLLRPFENLDGAPSSLEALVSWNEEGEVRRLTREELRAQVARFARGLRDAGVGPGDRVAGYLPNIVEAVVAMLATSSLGAVWSSCSPDFGAEGALDRFSQIEPKVLVCAPAAIWAGVWHDSRERLSVIVKGLPGLTAVVVADYGAKAVEGAGAVEEARDPSTSTVELLAPLLPEGARALSWQDFTAPEPTDPSTPRSPAPPLTFAQLPFDHPLYILYSSGTTGLPKGLVHGQGGTLLQHLKELILHTDLGPEDRILYYTTTGWMMWNWLVSSLATGATVILYDGSPLHGNPGRMWDLIDADRITHFGTSAKYLAHLQAEGLEPRATHDLSSLRTLLSTGSPLHPSSFDWVYGSVKPDLHLASISGGTDIVSCFMLGNPVGPVHRGELQCPGLGMNVEVWDSRGEPLGPGQTGELVCTLPFPAMPTGFWNDPDGSRYRAAYFEHFTPSPLHSHPVWRHGDWVERTEHGGFVVHGRSDTTLNPGGVRIGTAEIYRQIEQLPEVLEGVAIGQEWDGDIRVVLFVVLRDALTLDDALRDRIRGQLRSHATPRHRPAVILQVPEIPRTRSGKVSEVAVHGAVHGRTIPNRATLANPDSLSHFTARPELDSGT